MKHILLVLSALPVLIISGCSSCSHTRITGPEKYKARLEVAGICSNYTFRVIEGNIDTSLVVANWTNPQTGKSYKNAFAIKNPCDLPTGIKEGDSFWFTLDYRPPTEECVVCMAYYPTPEKGLQVKVLDQNR